MKQLLLTLSLFALSINLSYAQFDQEPDYTDPDVKQESTIEESVDRAILKIEKIVESINLEEIFEEDLPRIIDDVKPSKERMEEIEEDLKDGVERLKDFDSSKLDRLVEDIEEGIEEVVDEIEETLCKRQPQKI